MPGGDAGESASSDAEPEQRRDHDGDRGVAADLRRPAGERDRDRRDERARGAAEQQRHAEQRGADEPREAARGRATPRCRRARRSTIQQPSAPPARPSRTTSSERALHEAARSSGWSERVHQWSWWCGGQDRAAVAVPGVDDDRAAVGRLEHLARQRLGGRPKAIWRRLRQSTRSQRARLLDVVGRRSGSRAPRPPGRASSASSSSALVASRPVNGSSSSSTGASWTSARAISTRWRWPPESSPNGRRRRGRRGRRAPSASRAARALARAPGAATTGSARQRPHQRHVERGDRVVEARALGLRDVAAAARDARASRAAARSSPSRARKQRRLAAAVGAEQRRSARPRASANVDVRRAPAAPP